MVFGTYHKCVNSLFISLYSDGFSHTDLDNKDWVVHFIF